uniref:Uncharacterized protein n=1 Tax=Trichobilharzia regenti TaxID=157069 RepID=A0AA85J365_TRIRE|nr:unnamed protein product [Trichobilharzia regenti]
MFPNLFDGVRQQNTPIILMITMRLWHYNGVELLHFQRISSSGIDEIQIYQEHSTSLSVFIYYIYNVLHKLLILLLTTTRIPNNSNGHFQFSPTSTRENDVTINFNLINTMHCTAVRNGQLCTCSI